MTFDFVARIRQELRLTFSALEETVVSLAERVNRKVQLLRLHWQASQIHHHLAGIYRELGHELTAAATGDLTPDATPNDPHKYFSPEAEAFLVRSDQQVRAYKGQLDQLESRIVAMQSEVVQEDLLRFTRDLELRGLTLRYVLVARGSELSGRSIRDAVPTRDLHLVGVVRGPLVLGPQAGLALQAGDAMLILGPPRDVAAYAHLAAATRAHPRTVETEPIGQVK